MPSALATATATTQRIYRPTPSVEAVLRSDKTFRLLISPRGEGKTTTGLMIFFLHAQQQPQTQWPLKIALCRDTRRNIGITTARTIVEWFPEGRGSHWTGKELEPEHVLVKSPDGKPMLEFFCFGCDSAQDLSRFQSFEADGVWIEEPAPAADLSGGISGDVLAMAVTSLRRSRSPLVVISENPPDEDHWTATIWQLGDEPHEPDWDENTKVSVAWVRAHSIVCRIPAGENVHLTAKDPEYRDRNLHLLTVMGRPDLVNRLVHGKVGNVQVGEPVTPEYGPQYEVDTLPAARRGETLLMSWDPKANPSCVLWRPTPGSYCDVLAAFQGRVNDGMKQLLTITVLPWMHLHVPKPWVLLHTGDPNTLTADQSDSSSSATKMILAMLGGREWTSGPVGREDRRLPVHALLSRYHQQRPWIRLHKPHCAPLIKALAGGWHYKKDPSGHKISHEWVKDPASDIGEAFAYGCAYLYTREGADSTLDKYRKQLAQQARVREERSRTGI